MRQVPESTELMASKKYLRMLEETKLLNPDDLEIFERIRALRHQITELEKLTTQEERAA